MADPKQAVRIKHAYLAPIRHPIKAARLLYSAPPWVLSGPIYLIAMITFSALAYSFWATKNELVIAPMTLERESVTTEAIKGGIVSKIHVQEGTRVNFRDPLLDVQMMSVMKSPEEDAIQSKLDDLKKRQMDAENEYNAQSSRRKISLQQLKLSLDTIAKDRTLLKADLSDAKRNTQYLQGRLRTARREMSEMGKLLKSRDITKTEYDRTKSTVDDLNKSIQDASSKARKIETSLRALSEAKINNEIKLAEDELFQLDEQYSTQMGRLNDRVQELEARKIEAKNLSPEGVDQDRLRTSYKSSFSGLVSRIHVKPGNMIGPGEPLMTVVKDSAALMAKAMVKNQDIGRMKHGQVVHVKYFAYPYQDYGIPSGIISHIATKPSGQAGQESMYVVRIALEKETIKKGENGKPRDLEMGLEGIAEIKTGQKRFIELVFSPISKFFTQEEE